MLPLASFGQSVPPAASTVTQGSTDSCPSKSLLFAGMAIDADGVPNAYNAEVASCASYGSASHRAESVWPTPWDPQPNQPAEAPAPEGKPTLDAATTAHAHTP